MSLSIKNCIMGLCKIFSDYSAKEGNKDKLSRGEMKSLLLGEFPGFMTSSNDQATVDEVMTLLDENQDGEVDFLEFVRLIVLVTLACNECAKKD